MTRLQHDLRQNARSIAGTAGSCGCRFLVAGCSVRDRNSLCALEPQGSELKRVEAWHIDSGVSQLCCDDAGGLLAAIHSGGFKVWRLGGASAAEVACGSDQAGEQSAVAWGPGDGGLLVSASARSACLWDVQAAGVKVPPYAP